MISEKMAVEVAFCYREIEAGKKLLLEVEEAIKGNEGKFFDRWGSERMIEMGIPSGDNSTRMFKVHPKLALSVVRAHIADKEAELVRLNEAVRLELLS